MDETEIKRKGKVILIVGPTAVGKTMVAIKLAKFLSTEIVSLDSRQIYNELNIGSAKPNPSELAAVKHHLINSRDISQFIGAGEYGRLARELLNHFISEGKSVIAAGGSGLHVDATFEGFHDLPETDLDLRSKLNSRFKSEGLEPLQREVELRDPEYFSEMDKMNPVRIIRALEIINQTGMKVSDIRKAKRPKIFQGEVIKIGLERNRKELYDRIDLRVETMIQEGLEEEVSGLKEYWQMEALKTVGYQELIPYFQKSYDKEEAIRLIKRNSRRYAKRQLTWFHKDSEVAWFHPDDETSIERYLQANLDT